MPSVGDASGSELISAPFAGHEFAIVTITQSVACHVAPQISSPGLINVRFVVLQWIFIGDHAFKIVSALAAAIGDLPRFLVVVAGNRRRGPHVAVAGNFAGIVKIVEHAKLQRQLVLIGRDVCAVKSERRIAVAYFKVTKNLVVGAVFFDDVNHVMNGIRAIVKRQSSWIGQELHLFLCDTRKLRQIFFDFFQIDTSDRSVQQSWDVGVQPSAFGRHLGYIGRIWTSCLSLCRSR